MQKTLKVMVVLCLLALPLMVFGNVYPTKLDVDATALVTEGTDTISISFVLNEDADNGVDVKIYNSGGSLVRTITLASATKGVNSVKWDGKDDGGTFVDADDYHFTVTASDDGHSVWERISTPSSSIMYSPRGIAVNKDSTNDLFGTIYVTNPYAGTSSNTGATYTGVGVFSYDAAQNNRVFNADLGGDPHKIMIGPDNSLYINDWSQDLLYQYDADMSNGKCIVKDTNTISGQYISGHWVAGTGADRSIYTADGHYGDYTGIKKYDIGTNSVLPDNDTGTVIIERPNGGYYQYDVELDSKGNIYVCQYRADPNQAYPLLKYPAYDNTLLTIDDTLWTVPMSRSAARGLGLDEKNNRVAYARYYSNEIEIFDMTTGEYLETVSPTGQAYGRWDVAFDAVGNMYTVDNSSEYWTIMSPPDGANSYTTYGQQSITVSAPLLTEDLFFSQYIEGGSNNKALEIYNGTGAEVNLSNYVILINYNGNAFNEIFTFPVGTIIANEDVYVIAHADADAAITSEADTLVVNPYSGGTSYMAVFNGDDVRALCKVNGTDTTIIDLFGRYDFVDPGDGWDVAGVSEATKDHTLIRKSFVTSGFTDWDVIAGTSTANSEWTVLAKDTFTDLGSHTVTDFAPTTADVTFNVNTSTVRIITDSLSTVDLRGTATQWGPGTDLTCVGGDYWKLTIPLATNTGFDYKYGARTTNLDETESEWWENDIPGADYQGGNRTFATRYFDQTVGLDYLGHGPDNNTPNYTPSDSIDVFFRVNMGNDLDFNPDNILSIVGSLPANGADNIWSPGNYALTQEGTSDYWNIHLKLDPDSAAFDSMMYRFHNNGTDWGGHSENVTGHGMFPDNENRGISIGYNDTTIAWVWWNDDAPQPFTSNDSTDITFNANMSKASNNNSFTIGDTLLIKVGYGNSSTEVVTDTLTRMGFTFSYSTTIAKLPVIYDKQLFYQYYLYKYGVEQREVFFNFNYKGNDVSMNERRFYVVNGATEAVNDIENSKVDGRRMPIFRNNDKIAQKSLTLTLECDLRPAIYQVLSGSTLNDIQSNVTITPAMMTTNPDTILNLGVYVNGPLSNHAEGTWQGWGGTLAQDTTRRMYDDATHGDKWAGDSIFTIVYVLSSDSGHTVGQEFKYGIGGGDNESGYGLNHIENIDDSGTETTLYTQIGSINPSFYDAWDYDDPNPRVDKVENEIPTEFALKQNYPNPFNPSTTIEFAIPKLADVNLTIYNVLGQSIRNIQMNNTQAGRYSIIWNGTNDFGAKVSTGIYFYKIKAGKYSDIKKMVFMK